MVARFEGEGSFAYADATGTLIKEQNAGDLVDPQDLVKPESEDFYGLSDSNLDWTNKVQKCQAQLPLDRFDLPTDLFQEYNVVLGARKYADDTVDTNPIKLTEISYTYELTEPVYEFEDEFDPEVGFGDEVERELQEISATSATKSFATGNDAGDASVNLNMWVDNWVNK